MKKLAEQKQTLDDVSELIRNMESEINRQRYIIYRYYEMHGELVENGMLDLPDNISFGLFTTNERELKCRMLDNDKLGMESKHQRIIKGINKLK